MKSDGDILVTLAVQFALMSLLALGGANAVVPEMHRQAVELRGWMSDHEFTDMFAMSQAAPGPNVMLVTLIGYHVAGLAGAMVTTLAMCGPTAVLAHFLGKIWDRFQGRALAYGSANGRCADFRWTCRRKCDRFDGCGRSQLGRRGHYRCDGGDSSLDALEPALVDRHRRAGRTHRLGLILLTFQHAEVVVAFFGGKLSVTEGEMHKVGEEGSA